MSGDNDNNNGGRSLGGGSAEPLPSSWSQSNSAPRVGRIGDWNNSGNPSSRSNDSSRMRTLGDMASGGGPARAPSSGGRGGNDNQEGDGENWFAGGERSGISVQNPSRQRDTGVPGGNVVRDLLRRAAERGPPPEESTRGAAFSGGGHTLGSDDVDSSYVPDPDSLNNDAEPNQIRRLIFWRDGFTVEDGELMRYDDPNNEAVLAEIHSGRAPPSILNVRPGEPVELRVQKRTNEDYVPPQKGAFHGTGNRLGAPVPDVAGSGASSSMPGSFTGASSSSEPPASTTRSSISTVFEVDQTKPTTSVQVRLADGTRLVARMNLTHTVLDLRNFINASRPENLTRPYSIVTTFPNRVLDDNTATIEGAGLKNSVVVQKWDT